MLKIAGEYNPDGNTIYPKWVEIHMGYREIYSTYVMLIGRQQLEKIK